MKLLACVLLACTGFAFGQTSTKGIVTIDPKGHTANIKGLRFTEDGKYLITASDDKTARVWSVQSGALVNTLRGEVDGGNGGMLNSCAIWPGKPILVVGGFLEMYNEKNRLRLFNYETSEMLGAAFGPKSPVVSLDFTRDGKYLAGGATGAELAIWDLNTFKPVSLQGHTDGVYGVAFSPDGNSLVSGSYDSTVILWDLAFLRDSKQELKAKTIRDHKAAVRTVAYSPKGDYFVSSGEDNRVLLYNAEGELVKELVKIMDPERGEEYGLGDVHSLAFSDDGKKLAVGTGLSNSENVWVLEVPSGRKISSFFGHNNSVMALDFYGNDLIASAGGDNRDIFVWNANTGKTITAIRGVGRRVTSVAFSETGNRIAFGQTMNLPHERKVNEFGKLERVFDLENMTFLPYNTDIETFTGFRDEFDNHFLRMASLTRMVVYDASGAIVKEINFDPGRDGQIRSYTYTEDGRIVVGTNYRIMVFNNDCEFLRDLNGHTSEIYSLATKGTQLISGSADQTIKVWDLNDEGDYPMTQSEYRKMLNNQGASDERIDNFLKGNKLTFDEFYKRNIKKQVRPKLTLFPAGDEWIVYNHQNYYATSRNGSRFVGFHINNGIDTTATFYHFRQFDYQLNRPDLVLKDLGSSNTALIDAFKAAHDKRIKRSGLNIPDNNQLAEAPKLTIQSQPEVVTDQNFRLRYQANGEIKAVHVNVNSVPAYYSAGGLFKEGTNTHLYTNIGFRLLPGPNTVEIWAVGFNGVSSEVKSFTVVLDQKEPPKPNLYLVTLGASKYKQSNFNLTYAAKDASDVAKAFGANSGLYGKVNQLTLTDEKVTRASLKEINQFLSGAAIEDKVVIFYAGHGVFDSKFNYFLATHDMDFANPAAKGIAYDSLEDALARTKARGKLVFIDACHSGDVDKDDIQANASVAKSKGSVKFRNVGAGVASKTGMGVNNAFAVMKNMFADLNNQTGANVISSAGGLELAMESDQWKNGLFTYVLLDGLQNKLADLDKDGKITISEVNKYLRARVSELSDGKQVPTTRTENFESDYRIW